MEHDKLSQNWVAYSNRDHLLLLILSMGQEFRSGAVGIGVSALWHLSWTAAGWSHLRPCSFPAIDAFSCNYSWGCQLDTHVSSPHVLGFLPAWWLCARNCVLREPEHHFCWSQIPPDPRTGPQMSPLPERTVSLTLSASLQDDIVRLY